MTVRTIELIITGRVQKVGFRACVRKIAADLSVSGTVHNLPDGRVRVFASGDPIILEKFVSMLYSCPRAVIRDLKAAEIQARAFDGFSIVKGEISTEP